MTNDSWSSWFLSSFIPEMPGVCRPHSKPWGWSPESCQHPDYQTQPASDAWLPPGSAAPPPERSDLDAPTAHGTSGPPADSNRRCSPRLQTSLPLVVRTQKKPRFSSRMKQNTLFLIYVILCTHTQSVPMVDANIKQACISNNDVCICSSNPCEPKAQAPHYFEHSKSDRVFWLLALNDVNESR